MASLVLHLSQNVSQCVDVHKPTWCNMCHKMESTTNLQWLIAHTTPRPRAARQRGLIATTPRLCSDVAKRSPRVGHMSQHVSKFARGSLHTYSAPLTVSIRCCPRGCGSPVRAKSLAAFLTPKPSETPST